jgi:4-hydroxybenzoyl-CoA thioesterase
VRTSRHPVTVHWGDTDPAAIVYYPNVFRWFDQGTTTLFESAGFDWETLTGSFDVVGVPIVEAQSRFVAPLRFRDRIIVESAITRWSAKAFHISHKILNREATAVEGYEVRVLARPHPDDPARITACPIPARFRKAFE